MNNIGGDAGLDAKLEELYQQFSLDKPFPDVIFAWEAIAQVADENEKRRKHGNPLYPFPEWLEDYLRCCAEKIARLHLGIKPEDNRTIEEIGVSNVGELRKVRDGNSFRDARADHVGGALGFVRPGTNIFRSHDKAIRDERSLSIYDHEQLGENKPLQREIRRAVIQQMKDAENIDDGAAQNRLSKARQRQRKLDQKSS